MRINKKDFIGVIEKIPDDLLENMYAFGWHDDAIDGYHLQMDEDDKLLAKYERPISKDDESGYIRWNIKIGKNRINITMTPTYIPDKEKLK